MVERYTAADERVRVAQQILNSLVDIRPEYADAQVVGVDEEPEPFTVSLVLADKGRVRLTGLYATTILRAGGNA